MGPPRPRYEEQEGYGRVRGRHLGGRLDPWGGETSRGWNAFEPHRFTSYERDGNGSDQAVMRLYHGYWSRFDQPDPYDGSYDLTDPQSFNRYAYTQNDPVNFVDPSGLEDTSAEQQPCTLRGGGLGVVGSDGKCHQPIGEEVTVTAPAEVITITDPFGWGPIGGGGLNSAPGIGNLQDAAKGLSKKKLNNKNCQKDLAALGVTADQVRTGAASANFLNGVGSTVPLSSLYATSPVPNIRSLAATITGTVGDSLAKPGVIAQAQLGGPNIYVDPAKIKPADSYQNMGVAFHEVLHNITGLTDPDIQRALHLKETSDSNNITKQLIRDCL